MATGEAAPFHVEHSGNPESLEQLGMCLSMVAHEIRNLLTPLQAQCELALRSPGLDAPTRRALQLSASRSSEAVGAMRVLLEIARGESSHNNGFDALAEATRALEHLSCDSSRVQFDVPRGTSCSGPPIAFRLAVSNLIRNAFEAAGAEVHVRMTTARRPGHFEFTISDNGPGLPPDVLHNPFRAFQTTSHGSTGLGMAIAQSLIIACGGNVSLGSTGPGGTSWVITMPIKSTHNLTQVA